MASTSSAVTPFTFLFKAFQIPLPATAASFSSLALLLSTVTTLLGAFNFLQDLVQNPNPLFTVAPPRYDFIVVGAGTAGSVLANRLSANGNFKVLVLEAGGDPQILNTIPYLSLFNLGQPTTDWMYPIVPQHNSCFSYVNHSLHWKNGKSVGGTSNLNLMVYMRGNPNDFDNWARLTQDNQWTYDNLLPYFKRLENYIGNFPPDPRYHGTGGPLKVTRPPFPLLTESWLSAGKELGFPIADPNTRQIQSFVPVDAFMSNGQRFEGYEGYIKPVLRRPNLKLLRYAHVTKINLDSKNSATGVTYMRHGRKFTALATKEVILSAGAIGSPHLLMLSGIGPSEHLRSVGIIPKVNLPGVGQNLLDHVGTHAGPFILNSPVSFLVERDITVDSAVKYVNSRTGPLTILPFTGLAMLSSEGNILWPNIELYLQPYGISTETISFSSRNDIRSEVLEKYYEGFLGADAVSVDVTLGLPLSKGSITLRSKNPFHYPLLDPNYFGEPKDLEAMVEGFKFTVKLIEETEAFKKFNASLIPNLLPGCEGYQQNSDEYYACFIQHLTISSNHLSSTCKMGRFEDPMAVLDSSLRVKFVKGLRVVDASVFPDIPNANINGPVTMVGEKGADLILNTWITSRK